MRNRWLALLAVVAAGWLAPALDQPAWAQTITQCHPAASRGSDGPVDYGAYCWIDFSSLDPGDAEGGGQDFQVNLPGGVATLTFTLGVNDNQDIRAATVPSWTGAAFGNFAFNGIPGAPVLYQDDNNGQTTVFTLSNVTLNANGASNLPFVFVAADGESTNSGESLRFTTSGDPWDLVASPGDGQGYATPTLSYSPDGRTVLESGAGSGNTVSYVFTTDNSPGTVSARMVGTGLQGVIFGLKYYTIGLSVTKAHVGDFVVGDTGTYTIDVTNTVVPPAINPPADPQPVRVVDTLPDGLTYASASGTGWSCSAVGQVVTCNTTTLQDLTYTRTFPPITIGVTVDSDAPSTLTNHVEVSDPTESTLVFNVCELAGNGICPDSATSSTGDPTNILRSNLSTSTKSVVDLNGGYAQPGDTLRYTIVVKETGGRAATGVSVSDHIPAGISGFTVVGTPEGSTDSSAPDGGDNGTGFLDITGISVPANGTVEVVFDAVIASSAVPGSTIYNVATITNPSGPGATPDVETEIGLPQPPAATGNKLLYVYNGSTAANRRMTRTPQAAAGTANTIAQGASLDWTLTPVLQKPLTIEGGTSVGVNLVVQCVNNLFDAICQPWLGRSLTWTAELRTSGGVSIGTTSNATFDHVDYALVSTSFNVGMADVTIPAGQSLVLRIRNTSSSNNAMRIQQLSGSNRSTVSMDVSTVINVDSVMAYSEPYPSTSTASGYGQGSTVYLRAEVSDPFGWADVSGASIVVKDTAGATRVGPVNMVAESGSGAVRILEYAYVVPTGPPLGAWTATVTAREGSEGTVTHEGIGVFFIGSKVTLRKTWGTGATPGDSVSLTIGGGGLAVAGASTAPATTTAASARALGGSTITLAEAFTTGSAAAYASNLVCSIDGAGTAVPVSGSGLSRTITMPEGAAVTCTWTNTRVVPLTVVKFSSVVSDPINGTTNPKAIPGAVVEYQIIITNPGANTIDSGTVVVTDPIPQHTTLRVADIPGGTGPVSFTEGSPASGLAYTFTSLDSNTDDLAFSDTGGSTWTYQPVAGPDGYDAKIDAIRINPKGIFNAKGPSDPQGPQFTLRFRVRID